MLTTLIDVLAVIGAATVITAVALAIIFIVTDKSDGSQDEGED